MTAEIYNKRVSKEKKKCILKTAFDAVSSIY